MQPRRAGTIWSNEDAQLAQKGSRAAAKATVLGHEADHGAAGGTEAGKASGEATASEHANSGPRRSARSSEVQQASALTGKHHALLHVDPTFDAGRALCEFPEPAISGLPSR